MNVSLKNRKLNLRSPIFWRIAASVFASILLIEAILLAYSWFSEQKRVLERLDESLITVVNLLDSGNPVVQLNELLVTDHSDPHYPVIGFIHHAADGTESTGGQFEDLRNAASGEFLDGTDNYVYKTMTARPGAQPERICLLVDGSSISAYMRGYVLRILGMVMLISVFVTGACLLFLTPLLINPLQRLNDVLVRGEKDGIRNARVLDRDLNRLDELGSVNRSLNNLRDQLISAEDENFGITQRFEGFANLGADCFWEANRRMKLTYFSGDVKRVFGLSSKDLVGRPFKQVMEEFEDRVPHLDTMCEILAAHGKWEGNVFSEDADEPPISVRVVSTMFHDASGKIAGIRGTITDISNETRLASELHFQATHDELTGLANRRYLTTQIDRCIEKFKNDGEDFTLLMLDLDRFKQVNDTAGHPAGDALLNGLAAKFLASVRDSDTVARVGGDEFAIILRSCTTEAATRIAENIRRAIEGYNFTWNRDTFSVSVSIGMAQVTPSLCTHEAIVFAADTCCIKAKQMGKNQVQSYSTEDESLNLYKDETMWVARIQKALDSGHFQLHRQLIIHLDDPDSEVHFEILLRMDDLEGSFHSPALFLPVAERNHMMPLIDKWVILNAYEWLKEQTIPSQASFCMNINLSAASLADTGFRDFLVKCVHSNMAVNKYVCFEMTESAAMLNFDETVALLKQLRQSGSAIALDDFGTGYSSLSHIRDLPLDYIKIDGRFVQEISTNEVDQAVVKGVAEIAKVLKIRTVAEFVDSDEAVVTLKELGIDYAQGYLFSKPEPLVDLAFDVEAMATNADANVAVLDEEAEIDAFADSVFGDLENDATALDEAALDEGVIEEPAALAGVDKSQSVDAHDPTEMDTDFELGADTALDQSVSGRDDEVNNDAGQDDADNSDSKAA